MNRFGRVLPETVLDPKGGPPIPTDTLLDEDMRLPAVQERYEIGKACSLAMREAGAKEGE